MISRFPAITHHAIIPAMLGAKLPKFLLGSEQKYQADISISLIFLTFVEPWVAADIQMQCVVIKIVAKSNN